MTSGRHRAAKQEDGRLSLILPGVALAANLLQLGGVYWDVGTHHTAVREGFWSPPHLAIYSGVSLAFLAAAAGCAGGSWWGGRSGASLRFRRYGLALLGPAMQIVAAPIDETWHRLIGPDVSIWSPPHLLGILGGVVGVLGWIRILGPHAAGATAGPLGRALAFAFSVLLLAGALFALGEYDHDQGVRGPWLYPALTVLLAPWALVGARRWLDRPWGATAVAGSYMLVKVALSGGVWAIGLPWMGVPPFVLVGAIVLDVAERIWGPGAAGAAFGVAFTLTDYPLTYLVSDRRWDTTAWVGSLAAAAAAGWASAHLGQRLSTVLNPPDRDSG